MGVPTTISLRVLGLTCWVIASIQASAQTAAPGTVVAWGDNSAGEINVPPAVTNAIAVAGGGAFSLALNADGTVTAWGDDSFGQTNVPASLSNVVAISAGSAHALALKADGTIVAWGKDDFGQADVPLDLTNAVAVAAGQSHSLALRADGTVAAWGDNSQYQTDVPSGLSNAVAIAAGSFHSIALKSDGTVIAWGAQEIVPPGLNGVIAIAAGDFYSLAARSDGQVIAWGDPLDINVPATLAIPSAAIISPNAGTTDTSVSKAAALLEGNVVVNGTSSGPIVVDGNGGYAVFANGRVNYDTNYLNPPLSAYSQTNYFTANEIPDYTAQGTSNTLYDINRLIAVADATPNGYAPSGNNHFTNIGTFLIAATNHPSTGPMEGTLVVDVSWVDKNLLSLDTKDIPNGINVRGTLLFNFVGPGWTPNGNKIIITTALNVNPADLCHLVATNPATYTSGYPPTYADPTKNPININIAPTYQNFTASEDLPALVGTIGVVDLHGQLNISGSLYTPSYMEIENKYPNQTQYIKGSVIIGNGFYYENVQSGAISVISSKPRPAMAWIAAGAGHNLALRSDGALFSWGNLASLPAGLSNVVAVAAGGSHDLALIGNGPPTIHAPLANTQAGNGGFTVSAPTQSGRVYALEYKTSLGDTAWSALPLVAGNGGVVTFIDPVATDTQRFYRLRQW